MYARAKGLCTLEQRVFTRADEGSSLGRMKGLHSGEEGCVPRARKDVFPERGRMCSPSEGRCSLRVRGDVPFEHREAFTSSGIRGASRSEQDLNPAKAGGLGGLPPSSARKRVGVIGEGKNHRSERGFVPSPKERLHKWQFITSLNEAFPVRGTSYSERIRVCDPSGSGGSIRADQGSRSERIERFDSGVSDMPTRASGTYPLALLKGLHCEVQRLFS